VAGAREFNNGPGAQERQEMDYDDLERKVMDFFGDTSRSPGETKRDLLALAEKCQNLAETIDAEAADY
jgi:hypothetical protein